MQKLINYQDHVNYDIDGSGRVTAYRGIGTTAKSMRAKSLTSKKGVNIPNGAGISFILEESGTQTTLTVRYSKGETFDAKFSTNKPLKAAAEFWGIEIPMFKEEVA